MSEPQVKGWCPGAWRPMATGDGWLVRVRPPLGELTRTQALALCEAAERFGSGLLELTRRANIQLRGVTEASWPPLMAFLIEHQLVSDSSEAERQPQLMLAPAWQAGDATHTIARQLQARGAELAEMPAKVGIAIDAGAAPVLRDSPADFRIERSADGGLLVRLEGLTLGSAVTDAEAAVALLIRLTHWFMQSGGAAAGRMARHRAPLPAWAVADTPPAPPGAKLAIGKHEGGVVAGLPFGRVSAQTLRALVASKAVSALRVTPWRRLLIKQPGAAAMPALGEVIVQNDDPRLVMDACPGAPFCQQASVATHSLAERLKEVGAASVHISGCAKGCARRQPAAICLTGRNGRFDVIIDGRADSAPVATGLSESDVFIYLESLGALHL
ncbi:cobalamin biosynthesis protein CobG [Halomonas sp. GD1P12]|uniref:cobalamin biosynthesis protein CobG n=1 Tax=Halomonas sp. GD1P12 TaxID=2982691 RepID=UPI0021E413E7|nr:cobalamin biosynthesis protein CobG [Halomonas sp. GD1P12]UYG01245.1 cobalamin biosynthesis protein CobG [Halomonas sp. GD1P12]